MSKIKLNKEQRLEKRRKSEERHKKNEELRRKWSTEEHKKELKKTQEYIRKNAPVMIEKKKIFSESKPKLIMIKSKTRKKKKRQKQLKRKINGIAIPKQYLVAIKGQDNKYSNDVLTKENSNQEIKNRESANNTLNKKNFKKRAKNNGRHIVDTRKVLTVDSFVFATPSSRRRIQSNKIKYSKSNQSKNGWNDKNALKLKDYLKENKKLLDEGWID